MLLIAPLRCQHGACTALVAEHRADGKRLQGRELLRRRHLCVTIMHRWQRSEPERSTRSVRKLQMISKKQVARDTRMADACDIR